MQALKIQYIKMKALLFQFIAIQHDFFVSKTFIIHLFSQGISL